MRSRRLNSFHRKILGASAGRPVMGQTEDMEHRFAQQAIRTKGSSRLHISFIPFRWEEKDLEDLVRPYGHPVNAEIISNSRGSMGFGFVTMPDIEAAKTTIHALNGKLIKGRNIEVNFASPRRSRQNKGRRTSESAPQHPEPPTVISVATAEDEPTIPKRDKASCHMSDGKRIAMSQILHLKANPHDICKICAPPVYGKVTMNRSLSQKNSGLSLYSRRALVASNHIYMESKKSPMTLAEVDTSTPIISEPDYDVAPLCYQNLCSSTRFRFDSKSTDSDLYDSSSSFRALQQDVSNAMQQCEQTHPFPLDDPGRDYPISMKSTVTSDYSDRKIERELYSLFSPENRELSQAYEAFTDWAMR